jgi:hypothetical protein
MIVDGKEYITVDEMAKREGKKPNAIKQLLFNLGIKPIKKVGLYPLEAWEAIRNVPGKGRPAKVKPEVETPAKPKK